MSYYSLMKFSAVLVGRVNSLLMNSRELNLMRLRWPRVSVADFRLVLFGWLHPMTNFSNPDHTVQPLVVVL